VSSKVVLFVSCGIEEDHEVSKSSRSWGVSEIESRRFESAGPRTGGFWNTKNFARVQVGNSQRCVQLLGVPHP
jgi:hypothetical protein